MLPLTTLDLTKAFKAAEAKNIVHLIHSTYGNGVNKQIGLDIHGNYVVVSKRRRVLRTTNAASAASKYNEL